MEKKECQGAQSGFFSALPAINLNLHVRKEDIDLFYIIRFNEKEKWDTELKSMDTRDIYYFLDYCRLYQLLGDGDPYLFVYTHGKNGKVIYPFLKRKVKSGLLSENYFDVTTPYGYGGTVYSSDDVALLRGFRSAFHHYCAEENIVSEFIRFHPLMKNEAEMSHFMDVQYVRDTVNVDLTREDPFAHFHPSHRRNVRKAKRGNLTFEVLEAENAISEIDTFVKLYYETMRKNEAQPYYFFPKTYFEQLIKNLSQNVMMGVVRAEEGIVSAGLFLYEGEYLHYHLGCSDREYLRMAPNNLLFHEVALWGKQRGLKYFHLGGGYRNNDSLFQFKLGFNPSGKLPFYVGKMVHIQGVYDELIRLWRKNNTKQMHTDFFPQYRQ